MWYSIYTNNYSILSILKLKLNIMSINSLKLIIIIQFTISVPGNITLDFKANGVGHAEISFNYSNRSDSIDSPIQR